MLSTYEIWRSYSSQLKLKFPSLCFQLIFVFLILKEKTFSPSLLQRRPFGSSRNNPPQSGAETRDEPLRTSAWEARPSAKRNWDLGTTLHAKRREAREITNVAEGCRRPTSILLISYLRIATHWA